MWLVFAILTAVFWGGSDLFSKMGTNPKDKYSHLKLIIVVGTVMGITGFVMLILNFGSFDPMSIIRYLPVAALYIGAMFIGYIGLRYLDLSVSSPVCNSSGAIAALLCVVLLGQRMEGLQYFAIALVVGGVLMLSIFDMKDENKVRRFRGEIIEEKYRVSLIAILIPIFYAIVDALGTFSEVFILEGDTPIVSEDDAKIAYYLIFFLCAVLAFIYLVVIKKEKLNLWDEREKGAAALCETAGQFFYIQALSQDGNAAKAAPIISAYCVFSVIYSRLFLKEKLTARQYVAIVVAVVGIITMGFFDA